MELSDIFRILRQRGWLILVLMALTAAAAYGFSRIQTPVYESTLRLLVNPGRTWSADAFRQTLDTLRRVVPVSYTHLTMPMSSMPASRIVSITRNRIGLLATGMSCLALV